MQDISLALSGGGIRAMAFHMGVLRCLSKYKLIEKIRRISSVSGGSLLIGLILNESGMKWPDSRTYEEHVFPKLKEKLCSRCLMAGMLRLLIMPTNFHLLLYRANLLAKVLRNEWGVVHSLSNLPECPEISINGSTAETGKRFRFKKDTLGDYELGYADSKDFSLAEALAVSAAFPGGIGPLTIKTSRLEWKKRPHWDAPEESKETCSCTYKKLHLYDGGVYDNLGLEPFFDACQGIPKIENTTLLVSDASAPYKKGFSYFAFNPWRMKRMMDLMSEQTRALRVRGFHGHLKKSSLGCSYLWIQSQTEGKEGADLKEFACNFPTTLRKLSSIDFDKLTEHGFRVALASLECEERRSSRG